MFTILVLQKSLIIWIGRQNGKLQRLIELMQKCNLTLVSTGLLKWRISKFIQNIPLTIIRITQIKRIIHWY